MTAAQSSVAPGRTHDPTCQASCSPTGSGLGILPAPQSIARHLVHSAPARVMLSIGQDLGSAVRPLMFMTSPVNLLGNPPFTECEDIPLVFGKAAQCYPIKLVRQVPAHRLVASQARALVVQRQPGWVLRWRIFQGGGYKNLHGTAKLEQMARSKHEKSPDLVSGPSVRPWA